MARKLIHSNRLLPGRLAPAGRDGAAGGDPDEQRVRVAVDRANACLLRTRSPLEFRISHNTGRAVIELAQRDSDEMIRDYSLAAVLHMLALLVEVADALDRKDV